MKGSTKLILVLALWALTIAHAAIVPGYNIGSPSLTHLYVDSSNGNDANTGTSAQSPLRTVTSAWNKVPNTRNSATGGYQINLAPGDYPSTHFPNYWEMKKGSASAPLIITTTPNRSGVARFRNPVNMFSCSFIYFIKVDIVTGNDPLHFEQCSYMLLRRVTIQGVGNIADYSSPQEGFKANQCNNLYVEESDISNAWDNPVDWVSVQTGHFLRNKVHDSGDWCMYTKGGSANILVAENEFFQCGTGGFTAGQGTGFQYMTPPWIYYEAMHIKFYNNLVHHTTGAAIGVNGGYNILMAHNTFYNVGSRSHSIEFVFGSRSCDNDIQSSRCTTLNNQGGWGPRTVTLDESDAANIPNRNVYIYNNIVFNNGVQSQWQHIEVQGPRSNTAASHAPNPARADTNLQIRGNIFWNGPSTLALGVGDGACGGSNPTCNEAQLRRDNAFNTIKPTFVNAPGLDFHLPSASSVFGATTFTIPDFAGNDLPAIRTNGSLDNDVIADRDGRTRSTRVAGAYIGARSTGDVRCSAYSPASSYTANCPSSLVGAICTVTCASDTGSRSTLTCTQNGAASATWQGPLPTCRGARGSCSALTGLGSAYNAASCLAATAGATCQVTCASGWGGNSATYTCVDGQWRGVLPTCLRLCSALTVSPLYVATGCAARSPPGTRCSVACANGIRATNYTCVVNATSAIWRGELPLCTSCPAQTLRANANQCAGASNGGTCLVRCSTGFTMLMGSAATYTCTAGSWVLTAGTAPTCVAAGEPSRWLCVAIATGWSIIARVTDGRQLQCATTGNNRDCIWLATAACQVPRSVVSTLTCGGASYSVPNHWCRVAAQMLNVVAPR